jgi:hypothetical protein
MEVQHVVGEDLLDLLDMTNVPGARAVTNCNRAAIASEGALSKFFWLSCASHSATRSRSTVGGCADLSCPPGADT